MRFMTLRISGMFLLATLLAGGAVPRCVPAPEEPVCEAVDPGGYGACMMVLGVAFDGERCVTVSGCSCGDDCHLFFPDMAACEAACIPPLAEGEICGPDVPGECAEGLNCCYPCGIQGCDWVCTVPCDEDEPWCSGGCPQYP
jgi:hypothetical protein